MFVVLLVIGSILSGVRASGNPGAVQIPCYCVGTRVLDVISQIGPEVSLIVVVDDACPDKTGEMVKASCTDPRLIVHVCDRNRGVGGATLAGFRTALAAGARIIVKVDGDGQMDPAHVPAFAGPIARGLADYTKGNRFFDPEGVSTMPAVRLIGNAALSFLTKLSSGYWQTFDPTNGFVAIHADVLRLLPLEKVAEGYFFETDMLFRLNLIGARVADIPMHGFYGGESSHLRPLAQLWPFVRFSARNTLKRIVYRYFLREFSVASLQLVLGWLLILFGTVYGLTHWGMEVPATAGTVMVSALPILVGVQLLIAFLSFDIQTVPSIPLHPLLARGERPLAVLKHKDQAGAARHAQ